MRNPKWQREELILALDLYFNLEPGQIHAKNPQIIKLSEVLNQLPINGNKNELEKFRNPNGVGLKLSNFLALDDSYSGKGMSATSKLDKEIFSEFKDNRETLKKLATSIRESATNHEIKKAILSIDDNEIDDGTSRYEGKILHKYHLYRERNPTLTRKKKEQALAQYGKLECEQCGFDYAKVYGDVGYGFMECHHKLPLYLLTEEKKTKLEDLMLVCANCHRMLHRGWIRLEKNKESNKILVDIT